MNSSKGRQVGQRSISGKYELTGVERIEGKKVKKKQVKYTSTQE